MLIKILQFLCRRLMPLFAAAATACCGSPVGDTAFTGNAAALPVMENIALNARMCWFRSGDSRFRPYRLAPELKSYSDRPRILLVPYNAPNERPLLVVEAGGNPARVTAYGPLMQSRLSKRIDKDLLNWSKGGRDCR